MIYYNDTYYDDIEDLLAQDCEFSTEEPDGLDYIRQYYKDGITVTECKLIQIHQYTKREIISAIMDRVDEDYWPEDSDRQESEVIKAIEGAIVVDIEKLNKAMPEIWIPTKEKTLYTLEELEGML